MFKKLFAMTGIFIASTSIVCAEPAPIAMYLAGSLAYQNYYIKKNHYEALNPILTLGYGGLLPESFIYLAAEIFGIPKSIDLNNIPKRTVVNGKITPRESLKTSYSYGFGILPGYQLDTLLTLYVRLGGIYTRFSNLGTSKTGYVVGAGLEACFAPNWAIRGEYSYMKYKAITGLGQPQSGQYALMAVYRFL